MTSAYIRAPDDAEQKLLNHLRLTANGLMTGRARGSIVIVVQPDGVAMQGCVVSPTDAINAAHALLTFSAKVAEAAKAKCDCPLCADISDRIASALASLELALTGDPARCGQVR